MTKRQRQIREQREGAPFTYQIKGRKSTGKRRASAVVTPSAPNAEDECPLTLEPIATSTLPCLPGTSWRSPRSTPSSPSRAATPSTRSPSSTAGARTECSARAAGPCRAGAEDRADPDCLPDHLKSVMANRVQSRHAQEEQEDHAFHIYGVSTPYTTLADAGCLSLILSLHEQPASPLFMFRSRLSAADRPHGTFQPGDLRCVQQALDTGAVFLRLQVEMHVRGVGGITNDSPSTRPTASSSPRASSCSRGRPESASSRTPSPSTTAAGAAASPSVALSGGRLRLSEVPWLTEEADLELLSGDEGIRSVI